MPQPEESCSRNPDANRGWKRQLSSVKGVYLILDADSSVQHIGSAYGPEVWQKGSRTAPKGAEAALETLESYSRRASLNCPGSYLAFPTTTTNRKLFEV